MRQAPRTPPAKKRVLFVCIGNSCRSQMAEGFARAYGSDCMIAASAGVSPAGVIARNTMRAMAAKHIEMGEQFSKGLRQFGRAEFDLVINMAGSYLQGEGFGAAKVVDWDVPDPIGMDYEEHCEVRDAIERRVMALIVELRKAGSEQVDKLRGFGSAWR